MAAAVSGQRRGKMWKEWILVTAAVPKSRRTSELSVERVSPELGHVLVHGTEQHCQVEPDRSSGIDYMGQAAVGT